MLGDLRSRRRKVDIRASFVTIVDRMTIRGRWWRRRLSANQIINKFGGSGCQGPRSGH
jgi:hypothetical protein